MGLAAPRQRTKISHDPNNTRWTSDTSSFGLKIMTAQGWSPGEYLGAANAPHAELHTAANASYIRVAMREENLGLGAKNGGGGGAGICTGLDAFKDILGRLNGRDEGEIKIERQEREETRRKFALDSKWGQGSEGGVKFVTGGWLVGDKIQGLIEAEKERVRMLHKGNSASSESGEDEGEEEGEAAVAVHTNCTIQPPPSSKKRKRGGGEGIVGDCAAQRTKAMRLATKTQKVEEVQAELVAVKIKKPKTPKKNRESGAAAVLAEIVVTSKLKGERSKKKKNDAKEEGAIVENNSAAVRDKKVRILKKEENRKGATQDDQPTEDSDIKKRKKGKKHKNRLKDDTPSSTPTLPAPELTISASTKQLTSVTTNSSGASTPQPIQGRHAVRSRNIAQKRLACMDTVALNQIFMIKS